MANSIAVNELAVALVGKYIPVGVNGHEGRERYYPKAQMEDRIRLLADNNLRNYRTDVGGNMLDNPAEMNRLIGLCARYGVTLRPMIYPTTEAQAYAYAKAYGDRVKVWEIGNEVGADGPNGAEARVDQLVTTYRGMKRASDEFGLGLQFTVNVMACNSNGASSRCYGDATGDTWFLNLCLARGFQFDFVSFHYYAWKGEAGYWYDLYLGQLAGFARRFGKKVFLNEMNCGEIYGGSTGAEQVCVDSLRQFFTELNDKYRDVIEEISVYELLDEPNMEGVERNFGIRYDLARPKPVWDVVTEFARA